MASRCLARYRKAHHYFSDCYPEEMESWAKRKTAHEGPMHVSDAGNLGQPRAAVST